MIYLLFSIFMINSHMMYGDRQLSTRLVIGCSRKGYERPGPGECVLLSCYYCVCSSSLNGVIDLYCLYGCPKKICNHNIPSRVNFRSKINKTRKFSTNLPTKVLNKSISTTTMQTKINTVTLQSPSSLPPDHLQNTGPVITSSNTTATSTTARMKMVALSQRQLKFLNNQASLGDYEPRESIMNKKFNLIQQTIKHQSNKQRASTNISKRNEYLIYCPILLVVVTCLAILVAKYAKNKRTENNEMDVIFKHPFTVSK